MKFVSSAVTLCHHTLNMHNWRRGHNGDMREEVVPSRLQMSRSRAISAKNPSVVPIERYRRRRATRGGETSPHSGLKHLSLLPEGLGELALEAHRGDRVLAQPPWSSPAALSSGHLGLEHDVALLEIHGWCWRCRECATSWGRASQGAGRPPLQQLLLQRGP